MSVKTFMKWIFSFFAIQSLHADNISRPFLENETLYPVLEPFNQGLLRVSDLHEIYFSEFGNPKGIPVLTVHGGPGSSCSPKWSKFFDPEKYHIIMFDQRGAGLSKPFAEMRENTTQHSIDDMETLRCFLGIDQWILFGGSWGSTLSLLYSEAHPERVKGLVLRGVFLAREKDYLNLFYGMRNTYPDAWDQMIKTLGLNENCDLIATLYKMVMNPDPKIHLKAAQAFMLYDTICAYLNPSDQVIEDIKNDDATALSITRACVYYSANHFFIRENEILEEIHKIAHIPTIIVQGRYDLICPMKQAYDLHHALDHSKLWIIQEAGHSSNEPLIALGLKRAMTLIATL